MFSFVDSVTKVDDTVGNFASVAVTPVNQFRGQELDCTVWQLTENIVLLVTVVVVVGFVGITLECTGTAVYIFSSAENGA